MIRTASTMFALALGFSLCADKVLAQPTEAAFKTTTLNLSAQADVRLAPDVVTLALGVTSEATSAQEAMRMTSERLNAVVAALKRQGVAARDIQTQFINLSPKYSDNSNAPRQVVAHQANTTVTVTSRDLGRAGALIDAAVAAGANQVQGVRFGLTDPTVAQRKARDLALAALQRDASEVAEAMNQKVVRLVNVATQTYATQVRAEYRMEQDVPVSGSRIEPGEVVIRGSANGVFELSPK